MTRYNPAYRCIHGNLFFGGNYSVEDTHYPDRRNGVVVPLPSEDWPGWESPIATNGTPSWSAEAIVPPSSPWDWHALGNLVVAETGDSHLPRITTSHSYGAFTPLFRFVNRVALKKKSAARPGLCIFSVYLSSGDKELLSTCYALQEIMEVKSAELDGISLTIEIYKRREGLRNVYDDGTGDGDLEEYPLHLPR